MSTSNRANDNFVPGWQTTASIAFGLILLIWQGASALGDESREIAGWLAFVSSPNVWPYLVWSVVLAVTLIIGRRPPTARALPRVFRRPLDWSDAVLFSGAVCFGFGVAAWQGSPVAGLPPLYHDEYSYLFQAKTFLAGRFTFPSPPETAYFNQLHVLNADGHVASRYFPAVGAWIAPFLWFDRPMVSAWLAQGLVTGFISMAAARFTRIAGVVAAALVGTCPGLVVFGNTLLSPTVAMIGLAGGWWAFQATFDSRRTSFAILTGLMIGFSFLARPLTAVAIAGPWGAYALWQSLRGDQTVRRCVAAMIIGFVPAPILLAGYNAVITGSPLVTPYGLYTEKYTPSHVFGFYNRTRGEAARGAERLDAYDQWVEELTPASAVDVTLGRWERMAAWGGGLFPVALLGSLAFWQINRVGDSFLLPWLSLLSITLIHFPFFYSGVLGFSYIVEGLPFLLLLSSAAVSRTIDDRWTSGRRFVSAWWGVLILIVMAINLGWTLPQAFDKSSELVYPRRVAEQRRELEGTFEKPCLIIYDVDPRNDLHTTWVYNDPSFDGPILRAWALDDIEPLKKAFPERTIYLYSNGRYRRL